MSRKRLFILFGSAFGLTIIAVPAAIMSQWGSAEEAVWNHDIPELVVARDIRQKYRETDCLKDYFGNIDWDNITSNENEGANFPSFSTSSLQSCLTVAYQKQKYGGGKWTGRFKLVWSLSDGNNGLITTIKAKTEEGKLKLSSVAYLANNKERDWIITRWKENDEAIVEGNQNPQDLFNKIPQAGSLGESKKFNFFWGFNPELSKICEQDICKQPEGKQITSSTTWIFSKEQITPKSDITNWCTSLNTWLENTFKWNGLYEELKKIAGVWVLKSDLQYQ